jgi:isochorismate synthase
LRQFAKISWQGKTYCFIQGEKAHFLATNFEKDKKLKLSYSEKELILNKIVSSKKKQDVFEDKKSFYLSAANNFINEIESGNFDKIVLSKRKILSGDLDLDKSFENLTEAHPNASVFCFSDGEELWMGATPETLLEKKKDYFATMALAGSKTFDDENNWTLKEQNEHTAVVQDILSKLSHFHPRAAKTLSIDAGAVKHLQTEITFEGEHEPISVLNQLHPTTAVCGKPQDAAHQHIMETESSPRSYYTGYFGIQIPELTHFWVNLRSFQIFQSCVCLYLGGGFVAGSIAENEWEETEWKAQSLLPHLHFL